MSEPGALPAASVIVATFNRRDRLRRLLSSLLDGWDTAPSFEVVVVVDGSSDGTDEMLASLITPYRLVVLSQANKGPAAARNLAIEAARGEALVFVDDDVVPVPGLIRRHLEALQEDEKTITLGPMLASGSAKLSPWLRWEARSLEWQYVAMASGRFEPTSRQFYTANAAVRRDLVLRAGGFDERFGRAEDVELAYRLADQGGHFRFLPDAGVFHDPHRSFEGWSQVAYDYGRYAVRMHYKKRPQLRLAYAERSRRHWLSQALAKLCVGHAGRMRIATRVLSLPARYAGPGAVERAQMMACSAIAHLRYWDGVAYETGLGSRVWKAREAFARQ